MFNTWYVAGTSNEMKEYPVNRKILGEEITLFRDIDGQLHALQDLCPHRGARLSHGSVKTGLLTCPFHGWQFSGDGSCRHIPANGIHAPIPSGSRVKSFPVCEEAGYVWVFMGNHADMKPLKLSEEIRDPAWRKVPFETQWATHYTRVVESTLDVSHLPFVHRESTGPDVDPAVVGPSFHVNGDTIVVEGLRPKSVPLDLRAEQHVRSDGPQVRFRLLLRRALQQDAKLLGFQNVNGGVTTCENSSFKLELAETPSGGTDCRRQHVVAQRSIGDHSLPRIGPIYGRRSFGDCSHWVR